LRFGGCEGCVCAGGVVCEGVVMRAGFCCCAIDALMPSANTVSAVTVINVRRMLASIGAVSLHGLKRRHGNSGSMPAMVRSQTGKIATIR
jgi:hypothetical protein